MDSGGRGVRIPLRWRILLSYSAVLSVLIFSMLIYVNHQAHHFVTDRILSDLVQGQSQIQSAVEDQFSGLTLTARVLASIPVLKALLETDAPTIRDYLTSYQQQNRGVDLLIAFGAQGKLLARTDTDSTRSLEGGAARWTTSALADGSAAGMLRTGGHFYSVVVVPAEAGGTVFGFVLAGARMEEAFAARLREVSHDDVVLLEDRVVGSTIPSGDLPWRSRADWIARGRDAPAKYDVRIGDEIYTAAAADLRYPGAPIVVCLQSQDKALAPYRSIQTGLLILGLLVTTAGIVGSAILGRHLTAPVTKLVAGTREVTAGNFDFRLNISRNDEIGDLARAFNAMIEGLRQRADMQRFVSRSTVEMIQASGQHRNSAGKRTTLTIFFSDIRGFTALSERREPEFVVRILNHIFSVQTERIKQFAGDVDKFVGDAVVALFQGENGPHNAIRCALDINEAIDAYDADPQTEEKVHLGIGIATGEVILGSIGSEDRRDYTVIGSHVNLCARLCSLAQAGEILLAESTYLQVRDTVSAERLAPQLVKGFSEAIPVYRIASNGA